MPVLIPIDELESKYDVVQYNNKSIKYIIKKEFPEFEEMESIWKIEDNFLKIEFLEKEQHEELIKEKKASETLRILVQSTMPTHIKEECKKLGVSEKVAEEFMMNKLKNKFGSYSTAINSFHNYIRERGLEDIIEYLSDKINKDHSKYLVGNLYEKLFDKLSKDFYDIAPENFKNSPKNLREPILKLTCDTIIIEQKEKFGNFKNCLDNYNEIRNSLKEKIEYANKKFQEMMGKNY